MSFDYSSIDLSTAATDEPLTLDEVKLHLRVDDNAEDSNILTLMRGSREYIEEATRRALLTQTWAQYYDGPLFPRSFRLAKPPLQSVGSIKYIDNDGSEQTVSSAIYTVDITTEPARVYLAYNQSWPTDVRDQPKSIYVTFTSGYASQALVPSPILQAMKLHISHYFENREPVSHGQAPHELPMAIDYLLAPYRVWLEMRW